jgi:shikimate kinase
VVKPAAPEARRALALLGFMGAGKSTVGQLVAERTGSQFRDLDELVTGFLGLPIPEIFGLYGEEGFRQIESQLLPTALAPGGVSALGGGTALGDENWALIRSLATTVWLDAPFEVLWARIATPEGRPLLSGRSEAQVAELLEVRRRRYAEADHRVDATQPLGQVVREVAAVWSS